MDMDGIYIYNITYLQVTDSFIFRPLVGVFRTVAKKIVDGLLEARSEACWVTIVREKERENAGTKQEDKLAC